MRSVLFIKPRCLGIGKNVQNGQTELWLATGHPKLYVDTARARFVRNKRHKKQRETV